MAKKRKTVKKTVKKSSKNYASLYLLGMVACVAIVALFVLVSNTGTTSLSDEDLAGQGYYKLRMMVLENESVCWDIPGRIPCLAGGCYWTDWGTGGTCGPRDCWNFMDETNCTAEDGCVWYAYDSTDGWCED